MYVRHGHRASARLHSLLNQPFIILGGLGTGVHSASDVATRTRYALFTSFFHETAIGTTLSALRARVAVGPASKFPQDLRDSLPTELHGLLEWQLPDAVEEDVAGIVRDAPAGPRL
eukprot:COSAG02_NODE_491_length_21224_cov_5.973680_18_plen_116_part_00